MVWFVPHVMLVTLFGSVLLFLVVFYFLCYFIVLSVACFCLVVYSRCYAGFGSWSRCYLVRSWSGRYLVCWFYLLFYALPCLLALALFYALPCLSVFALILGFTLSVGFGIDVIWFLLAVFWISISASTLISPKNRFMTHFVLKPLLYSFHGWHACDS